MTPKQPSDSASQDNSAPSLQKSESEFGTRKMAIPRLAEGAESAFTSPGRFHRRHVRRACESCRQRKTKCTGDKSGCRNCREAGIICCYTDGKREKSKRYALRKASNSVLLATIDSFLFLLPQTACKSVDQSTGVRGRHSEIEWPLWSVG